MTSDFSYLSTPTLRTRQVLAAYFVRKCRHVLEIGGGRNPITRWLASLADNFEVVDGWKWHKIVTVVDPAIEPWEEEPVEGVPWIVRHLPIRIEDYRPRGDEDGLVMLGFEGDGHCDLEVVCRLIAAARVTVIEASGRHAPAAAAIGRILARHIHPVAVHLATTYRGAGVPESHPFCERNFYVLEARSE